MSNARVQADALRAEATKILDGLLKIPEGYSSGATTRFVECIVCASVLETAITMRDAAKQITTSENP